jgi:hypothetical protein
VAGFVKLIKVLNIFQEIRYPAGSMDPEALPLLYISCWNKVRFLPFIELKVTNAGTSIQVDAY